MNDFEGEAKPSSKLTILWIILLGLVAIFVAGIMAGYLIAHFSHDGATFSLLTAAISLGGMIIIVSCIYLALRLYRTRPEELVPVTRKEKLSRNIIMASGFLGGLIGLVLVISSPDFGDDAFVIFSDSPIPPSIAIIMSAIIGLIIPALTFYWHKNAIDEQESFIARSSALPAFYFFLLAGPIWWILARGDVAPPVNGIWLYFITLTIFYVFYIKNKYF